MLVITQELLENRNTYQQQTRCTRRLDIICMGHLPTKVAAGDDIPARIVSTRSPYDCKKLSRPRHRHIMETE